MDKEITTLIFAVLVSVLATAGIATYVVAQFAVYSVYGGEDNGTDISLTPNPCEGEEIIGIHSSCGHIQIYCKKFWWPLHCYSHCEATDNYYRCRWITT